MRKGMAPHLYRHVPIPHITATAILIAGVVTTVVSLHTDVFEDSHGGRVTTAPLHPPHNRHVLFRYPLSAYLVSSSTCWKPSAPKFRKRHWQSTQKGSSGGVCLCCWDLFKFLIVQRASMSGRNDGRIRVEISWLLAKVLTSAGWMRSVWNSRRKFWTQGKYPESQVSSSLSQTSMPVKYR